MLVISTGCATHERVVCVGNRRPAWLGVLVSRESFVLVLRVAVCVVSLCARRVAKTRGGSGDGPVGDCDCGRGGWCGGACFCFVVGRSVCVVCSGARVGCVSWAPRGE